MPDAVAASSETCVDAPPVEAWTGPLGPKSPNTTITSATISARTVGPMASRSDAAPYAMRRFLGDRTRGRPSRKATERRLRQQKTTRCGRMATPERYGAPTSGRVASSTPPWS